MLTPSLPRSLWPVTILLGIAACGPGGGSTCTEGTQQTCGCPAGAPNGVQVCGADGAFGDCDCGSSTTSSGGASSTGGGGTGGTSTGGTSTGGTGGVTGTTSSTTQAPCEMVFQGSFTIQNALDVETLTPYCEITGNLKMNSPGLDTLSLPNLRTISGDTEVVGSLVLFDMPALESAGGVIVQATTISLPVVKSLGGYCILKANSPMSLPKLETTGGTVTITATSGVDLPELVTAGGAVGAQPADGTPITFTAPKLVNAGGVFGGPISTWDFSSLTTVGTLGFLADPAANFSFPKLVSAGGVYFTTSGTVSAPNLVNIGPGITPDLDIHGWSGIDMPKLETIGRDLWIHDSPMTTLHLPALKSIGQMFRVGGDDPFADSCAPQPAGANPALVALDLPALVNLGGPQNNGLLNLGPNPALPQCVWDSFVAKLQANGWTGLLIAHPNLCPLAAGPCP